MHIYLFLGAAVTEQPITAEADTSKHAIFKMPHYQRWELPGVDSFLQTPFQASPIEDNDFVLVMCLETGFLTMGEVVYLPESRVLQVKYFQHRHPGEPSTCYTFYNPRSAARHMDVIPEENVYARLQFQADYRFDTDNGRLLYLEGDGLKAYQRYWKVFLTCAKERAVNRVAVEIQRRDESKQQQPVPAKQLAKPASRPYIERGFAGTILCPMSLKKPTNLLQGPSEFAAVPSAQAIQPGKILS